MSHAPMTDFVPLELDGTSWESISPYIDALLERDVKTPDEFVKWMLDRSELEAGINESTANTYIDMSCATEDEAKQSAWTRLLEEVVPKLSPAAFELDKKMKALFDTFELDAERYGVLERVTRADIEIYRDENVPIATEVAKLDQQYDKVCGSMTMDFDGEERTIPMMAPYSESNDRAVRESAWRAVASRRLEDKDAIDTIYDDMISKRHTMALNAGFKDFVGYAYTSKHRFDYGPEDARAFQDAIEKHAMPFVAKLDETRKSKLGLNALRPWDLNVDPLGRDELRPFKGGADLVRKTQAVFTSMREDLGEMFRTLGDGTNASGTAGGASLDLDSRKGKAPGGYQYMRDRSRRPFIFMNSAGVQGDVETMIHEAGHAFHSMYSAAEPLVWYRSAPIEFAEVASMSMELLTMPHWGEIYESEDDANRARRKQLEGSISLLPWIATIDAFQHWVYANPTHTRDERTQKWIEITDRFGHMGHRVDWSGLEAERANFWQKQGHLFGVPFYYIEYGIAQLGALGIWLISKEQSMDAALDAYKRAMTLGGSRPLPELFEAAGLDFDFGDETVGRLVSLVQTELDALPE